MVFFLVPSLISSSGSDLALGFQHFQALTELKYNLGFVQASLYHIELDSHLKENLIMSTLREGTDAFEEGNFSAALVLLEPFALQGNAEAQCILGNIYHLNLGGLGDPSKALFWYLSSSQQGYSVATNNLAGIYLSGECGVEKDANRSKELYLTAREQGFIHSPRVR
jgi:TPR repeat protein